MDDQALDVGTVDGVLLEEKVKILSVAAILETAEDKIWRQSDATLPSHTNLGRCVRVKRGTRML